jgi:hypothetical protein
MDGEGDARNTTTLAIVPNTEPGTERTSSKERGCVLFDDVDRNAAPRGFELMPPRSLFAKEQRALADDVDRNAGRVARGAAVMPTISSACRCDDTGRYLGTENHREALCRRADTRQPRPLKTPQATRFCLFDFQKS